MNQVADAATLAAAERASINGKRMFSANDVYVELGLTPGKGPKWAKRHELVTGFKITHILTRSGYAVCKEYPALSSTRRYYKQPCLNESLRWAA